MESAKNLLIVAVSAFLVLQLAPPPRNTQGPGTAKPISAVFQVPPQVDDILRTSCYDCHSNSTRYPWYASIQPVGWWLHSHIEDGKADLNFDSFGSYRPFRQYRRLQQMKDLVEKNEMPLESYLLMHRKANLSEQDRAELFAWTDAMRDTMKAWYPADSLQRRRPPTP